MFTLFFRAIILYAVMILTMRGLGKRQLGQLQPYELALTILLADIISSPMESISTPLLHGILPVAAVFCVHCALSLVCMRFDKVRACISGKPSVVISKGVVDRAELKRLCLSLSDLLEGLRSAGILDPAEVGTAVIEANGTITAFQTAENRAPKAKELGLHPGYEGMPLMLVLDGRLQKNNLEKSGRDEAWLSAKLNVLNASVEGAYFASLDTSGALSVQRLDGTVARLPDALPGGEVGW